METLRSSTERRVTVDYGSGGITLESVSGVGSTVEYCDWAGANVE